MNKTTLNSQEEKHSMLSLRRTTSVPVATRAPITVNFYPRSPCGERHGRRITRKITLTFLSTLSLRRATILAPLYNPDIVFLSTLSLRRATSSRRASCSSVEFLSTLSLRRATRAFAVYNPPGGISIHALLAESDVRQGMATLSQPIFLSTLSLRRATDNTGHSNRHWKISIHALLAESDERQYKMLKIECNISIHALLAESDDYAPY